MFVVVFVIISIYIFPNSGSADFGTEFCQLETFDPKCSSNEVIQIEKALLGRMRVGKCITDDEVKSFVSLIHDKKYFHCSVDVSEMIRSRCSFRQECKVPVSDESLKRMNPCGPGLFLNLEVKYKCLSVFQADRSDCRLQVFQEPKYFLFESFQSKTCGKHNNPWLLEVSKGQKISVAIVGDGPQTDGDENGYCESLGLIVQDGYGGSNSSLCKRGFQNERSRKSKSLYSSSQNIVRVYVTDDSVSEKKLALKLQAEGCLDIIPPEDTWLKRTNDDIVLGCYNSKQTWYLRCEQRQWVGAIGNCSLQKASHQISAENADEDVELGKTMPKHQQILAIVSISGVGVVICSLIVCFGALFARRYSLSDKGKPLKFANQSLSYDNGPYHQHTYNTGGQSANNSGYESEKLKNGYPSNIENNQTYFVLEDEIDNK